MSETKKRRVRILAVSEVSSKRQRDGGGDDEKEGPKRQRIEKPTPPPPQDGSGEGSMPAAALAILRAEKRKAERAVADIPFKPPPPKDPSRCTDLLMRVFHGEGPAGTCEARQYVYEYVCKAQQAVYPAWFVDRVTDKPDNMASQAYLATSAVTDPILKSTLQCFRIIDALATLGNIDAFYTQFEARCDPVWFTNFMKSVSTCLVASTCGIDIRDVGQQRVKNATPTFGVNLHTFTAMMRASYGGALVPLNVPSLQEAAALLQLQRQQQPQQPQPQALPAAPQQVPEAVRAPT